ncbi:MAG: DUF378 domain-containing protein [Candidatus Omnitrophica bacterium]|nr:DUF378 domain-containing protein [Candidatus Omnitrophota bacterium]
MTSEKSCVICKVVGVLVGVGALNWGLLALFNVDLVAKLLGPMTGPAKLVYILIGVAGALKLLSLVKCCPCQSKGCDTKK